MFGLWTGALMVDIRETQIIIGGYIECLKDGTYTMGLNLEILDSDTIEPLEKKLFAEHDGINKKKA